MMMPQDYGPSTEPTVLFYAWDGSQGRPAQHANATVKGHGTPFSKAGGEVKATVMAATKTPAPIWTAKSTTFTPILLKRCQHRPAVLRLQ